MILGKKRTTNEVALRINYKYAVKFLVPREMIKHLHGQRNLKNVTKNSSPGILPTIFL